jgi:hypothetical protein
MIAARASALAFAAVLGLTAVAHAQMQPPPPPAPGAQGEEMARMHEHMRMREEMRVKALHDVLAIRPDQEAAFQAFAASMHPEHGPGMAGRNEPGGGWRHEHEGDMAAMTAPERLEAMLKRFDERTARMRETLERHATAVRGLYAVLGPDQKRTLDALPMLIGHGGMGGAGGEGHGPHDGMMGPPHPGEGE